jgi:8-oxo-dGTP diphosphatase
MKITADIVLFGYDLNQKDLKILLIKRNYAPFIDEWALSGGFVSDTENLESAVSRIFKFETSIETDNIYLEQLYSFGEVNRDPRERIITISYYGLSKTIETSSASEKAVKWFSINEIPKLAFDHIDIVNMALKRLRGKIIYQPIGFELLPDKFTMDELLNLYETILNKKLDKRNFSKKIRKYDILEFIEERNNSVGRPKHIYKFNKEKYNELLNSGFYFEL